MNINRKIKVNKKSKLVRFFVRALTTIGVVVVYYLIFSVFFDTPIEYQLKKSTRTLQEHYAKLEKRYDSLQVVLDNLAHRDSAVYEIIYEAQPYSSKENRDYTQSKLDQQMSSMSNKDLGDLFFKRLDKLLLKANGVDSAEISIMNNCMVNANLINKIPSIQPIANANMTLLATSFGRRINPFFKTMQDHNGIDYAVLEGTAVFATADGVISQIQTRGSNNGLSLTIDHGNGYKTVYAYLSKTYGMVGNKVNRGDVIAFSGNSGLSYAPHLHYEVRKDGVAVNPIGYLFLELNKEQLTKMYNISAHAMQAFD